MLNAPTTELLNQLRHIVGPAGVLDQPQDIAPFLVDHRKLYRGRTPLVLRPDSTAQVSSILRLCHGARVGVVPVGGNTGYCGGATPSSGGHEIVVSLSRLKRIRHLDPDNYALTAEAGCVLAVAQQAAAAAERLFPLSLGSEGSCQLGGNLSTNAGGTAVLRYGMARDLVLGLEVVLSDGRVLDDLTGLRKNNTGYDLRDLFIGAEGTLGIITAATLKLYPLPRTRVTALVAVAEPASAVALLAYLRSSGSDALTTFELIPRIALELVCQHIAGMSDPFDAIHPWYVLLEASSAQVIDHLTEEISHTLARALADQLVRDALLAHNASQREFFWRLREAIPEAQVRAGGSIKHDVSVSISDLPAFIAEGAALCRRIAPEGVLVIYGHLGDGSLHFNINTPDGGEHPEFFAKKSALNHAVHDLTRTYRGSISAEHGIGQLKRDDLVQFKQPVALQVMHAIKQALDPQGIMNPGKVLAAEANHQTPSGRGVGADTPTASAPP
ncbi:MAG: FAD-binding oxidoreductase [Gammaproteobacteria bacterium]|nr:FAD-binding oxidoreductase [Gammaproteobacteria bacterium]